VRHVYRLTSHCELLGPACRYVKNAHVHICICALQYAWKDGRLHKNRMYLCTCLHMYAQCMCVHACMRMYIVQAKISEKLHHWEYFGRYRHPTHTHTHTHTHTNARTKANILRLRATPPFTPQLLPHTQISHQHGDVSHNEPYPLLPFCRHSSKPAPPLAQFFARAVVRNKFRS